MLVIGEYTPLPLSILSVGRTNPIVFCRFSALQAALVLLRKSDTAFLIQLVELQVNIVKGKMIEPVQMADRSIHEEAKNLHEHLGDRQALTILLHCTEQAVNNRIQPYVAQVQCEDAQTGPAGLCFMTW